MFSEICIREGASPGSSRSQLCKKYFRAAGRQTRVEAPCVPVQCPSALGLLHPGRAPRPSAEPVRMPGSSRTDGVKNFEEESSGKSITRGT